MGHAKTMLTITVELAIKIKNKFTSPNAEKTKWIHLTPSRKFSHHLLLTSDEVSSSSDRCRSLYLKVTHPLTSSDSLTHTHSLTLTRSLTLTHSLTLTRFHFLIFLKHVSFARRSQKTGPLSRLNPCSLNRFQAHTCTFFSCAVPM